MPDDMRPLSPKQSRPRKAKPLLMFRQKAQPGASLEKTFDGEQKCQLPLIQPLSVSLSPMCM